MTETGIADVDAPYFAFVLKVDRIFKQQQMERQLLTKRINEICPEPEQSRSHRSRPWR